MSVKYGAPFNSISGSVNETFSEPDGAIRCALPDGVGGWYIGGGFSNVGDVARNGLAHILADGTVDPNFNPDMSSTVNSLALSGNTYMQEACSRK
jgi:hypothetical protein